jgi:hypothetical protein
MTTPTYPQPHSINNIDDYRLKAASFVGENHEVFVAAVFTLHKGKAVMKITAIEITIDRLLDIGPPEAVLS